MSLLFNVTSLIVSTLLWLEAFQRGSYSMPLTSAVSTRCLFGCFNVLLFFCVELFNVALVQFHFFGRFNAMVFLVLKHFNIVLFNATFFRCFNGAPPAWLPRCFHGCTWAVSTSSDVTTLVRLDGFQKRVLDLFQRASCFVPGFHAISPP